MQFLQRTRILLSSSLLLLLTACGGGSSVQVTDEGQLYTGSSPAMQAYYDAIDAQGYNPEDPDATPPVAETLDSYSAMEKIKAFAQDDVNNPPPTVQDFQSAGLDVDADTWPELLDEIDDLDAEGVDTLDELQAAENDAENGDPVAFSLDLELAVDQEAEIEMEAEDEENGTLSFMIVQQPHNGTARVEGNKLIYTPNAGYSGYDELTYAVSDGEETSEPSSVSITVGAEANIAARAPANAGTRHIVWFNGTSESFAENQHLFDGLTEDQYTRFAGLGISPLDGWYSPERVDAKGIMINYASLPGFPTVRQKIDQYIQARLNEGNIKQNIMNADHLMVGGFSRGAAFFMPYFLDNIDTFLPNLNGQGKTLTIFAMDPVDGSEDESDNTRQSIIKLGFRDKSNLIQKLKNRGFDVRMIYMSSGFDYRQKNFGLDKTFYDQKDNPNFTSVLTAKMGLTHATMSSWNGAEAYGKKTLTTSDVYGAQLVLGDHYWGWRSAWRDTVKRLSPDVLTPMFIMNFYYMEPDLEVTRKIFRAFSNERLNPRYYCSSIGGNCTGSKEPGSVKDIDATIQRYYETTETFLGENAGSQGRGIVYPMFGTASHAYFGGNRNFKISGHSRLGIKLNGKLENVLPPYSYYD